MIKYSYRLKSFIVNLIPSSLMLFGLAQTAEAHFFTEPHEYFRAVGTIGNPEQDDRYRGPKATEKMASLFGEKLKSMRVVDGVGSVNYTITWRCSKGNVLACWEPNDPLCGLADIGR